MIITSIFASLLAGLSPAPAAGGQSVVLDLPPVEWAAEVAREAARHTAHLAPQPAAAPLPPVVTVRAGQVVGVDLTPPQRLDVTYDEATWGDGSWGGDASLAWATSDCEHSGGTPDWSGGRVLVCRGVDY